LHRLPGQKVQLQKASSTNLTNKTIIFGWTYEWIVTGLLTYLLTESLDPCERIDSGISDVCGPRLGLAHHNVSHGAANPRFRRLTLRSSVDKPPTYYDCKRHCSCRLRQICRSYSACSGVGKERARIRRQQQQKPSGAGVCCFVCRRQGEWVVTSSVLHDGGGLPMTARHDIVSSPPNIVVSVNYTGILVCVNTNANCSRILQFLLAQLSELFTRT